MFKLKRTARKLPWTEAYKEAKSMRSTGKKKKK